MFKLMMLFERPGCAGHEVDVVFGWTELRDARRTRFGATSVFNCDIAVLMGSDVATFNGRAGVCCCVDGDGVIVVVVAADLAAVEMAAGTLRALAVIVSPRTTVKHGIHHVRPGEH